MKTLQSAFEVAISAIGAVIGNAISVMQTALEITVSQLGALLESAISALEPLLTAITDVLDDVITAITDIAVALIDYLISVMQDILDAIIPIFGQFISDVVDNALPFLSSIWDTVITSIANIIDPSGDLKTFIDNAVSIFNDGITSLFNLLSFGGLLMPWIVIFVTFTIFSMWYWTEQNPSRGSNDPTLLFRGLGKINENMFSRGYNAPNVSLFGFSLGALFLPMILILYVALKILIATGTFPDIFGGLPI